MTNQNPIFDYQSGWVKKQNENVFPFNIALFALLRSSSDTADQCTECKSVYNFVAVSTKGFT